MTTLLTILHVATAVIFLGPVMVSSSLFGKNALQASKGDDRADAITSLLHGITKLYGYLSAVVPLIGATMLFTDWPTYKSQWHFHVALVVSAAAWGVLFLLIIPRQAKTVEALSADRQGPGVAEQLDVAPVNYVKEKGQQAMFAGIFNLLWVVVLVLMYL
ncbi:hypothetical protein [Corynebacterium uterequi]|uniref:DUF2269 domain-containing protein n=1 Tax=Corynebacterium uterequi TaxID=1072256 RepID=A0A0G3HC28_9CORY|nr:hypothetical protein [Corynebacterium uterequi]AKK10854.1 hypothetical protein CUTER_04240 [Corynebacterium uterequi]